MRGGEGTRDVPQPQLALGGGVEEWRTEDVPSLQRREEALRLPGLEVMSNRKLDLELLVLLVEFAADEVEVDAVDDQVLQFAYVRHVELLEESAVW